MAIQLGTRQVTFACWSEGHVSEYGCLRLQLGLFQFGPIWLWKMLLTLVRLRHMLSDAPGGHHPNVDMDMAFAWNPIGVVNLAHALITAQPH